MASTPHPTTESALPSPDAQTDLATRLARLVSGRRAWVVLLAFVLAVGAVLGSGIGASTSTSPVSLPPDAESAVAAALLDRFPDGDSVPLLAVATRAEGADLDDDDLAALATARTRMLAVDRGPGADVDAPPPPAPGGPHAPGGATSAPASPSAARPTDMATASPVRGHATTAPDAGRPSSVSTSDAPGGVAPAAPTSPSAARPSGMPTASPTPGRPPAAPGAGRSSAAPTVGASAGVDPSAPTGPPSGVPTGPPAGVAGPPEGVTGAPGGAPRGMPTVVRTEDGKAAMLFVPVSAQLSGLDLTEVVEAVRAEGRDGLPAELTMTVTGGPAFAADIANVFSGADVRLLLATAAVVALLLLLTYRSPILWLVPLLVVAVADRVAAVLSGVAAEALGFVVDGSTSGITSVLVFGAGTNYALLIVSRYREELRRVEDHRVALTRAVRAAAEPVLASNLTVVLALSTLLLASLPNTRVLGVSAAVGLLVALVLVLVGLPAALSVCGRRLFWPFVPRCGDRDPSASGGWRRLATWVVRGPWWSLALTLPILAVCVAGLAGLKVGLDRTEQFRVEAESVSGLKVLQQHQPAGTVTPTDVVAPGDSPQAVAAVLAAVTDTPGVASANPVGTHQGQTAFRVVLDAEPSSEQAFDIVRDLRERLDDASPEALVGGADAEALDTRDAGRRDFVLVTPLILGVVLAVLYLLLRAAWAPLILIAATCLSTLAAIGAGVWLSRTVFGFPAIDVSTPLFAVLFLIALGVDYTIFLVTRAREESAEHGTREGMVRAVALTGGVITSAGVVLAAVFAVLGVLPLITLTQLGIIVGIGILLDTFLVRTVLVPALVSLVGDRFWWPQRPGAVRG